MPSAKQPPAFRTIQQFKPDYAPVTITQYVSERTGMQVVTVDQKGPKVNGYFTLATEIFDDSGSPHTLEHLCFMGSKSYKYKGVLDKLATRAYSNTNAWTATDHTAYTLDSAGWDGFAQILPVYLEHVLLPTITDEACATEVWHIDGEGNDAGVVYSEMQGVQNTGSELMALEAKRLLYPKDVGFRYETGGMMEQLRTLTPQRIREFHKEMYQPRNLCLVITGEVQTDDLLRILTEFEDGIIDEVPSPDTPFRRPWVESAQPKPLEKSVLATVEFPEEDEETGDILVGFLGPDCNDNVQSAAMNVLLTYLAGSSVSILENVMVEKEHLCSAVSFWWEARPDTAIWLSPSSVATEKLHDVEKRLFELLNELASKPLDMKYMSDCVKRELRTIKHDAETSTQSFPTSIITDFLFGKRDGSTLRDLATTEEYDVLAKWSEEDWRSYLRKWLVDAHHVSIIGVPSKKLAEKMKAEEVNRLAERRKALGEEGLKKLAEKLQHAKDKNDAEIPKGLLEQWPIPGVDSVHFIETGTARSGLARRLGVSDSKCQQIIDAEKDLGLFIQFEDIPSNFVQIQLLISTANVPVEHRPLVLLFSQLLFDSPIMRDGKRIEFEQVVTELERDTVSYEMSNSNVLGDPEDLVIKFEVEPEKYGRAIEWITEIISNCIFDPERLKASIVRILADIPQDKREGSTMLTDVVKSLHFADESFSKARNTLVRGVYMKRLKKLLATEPQTVIFWLELISKSLFVAENLRVLVVADVSKLQSPVAAWNVLLNKLPSSSFSEIAPIVRVSDRVNEDGKIPGNIGTTIVAIPAIDSSYLMGIARGPTSFSHPSFPALVVATAFLDAVEGPMWTAVRGTGLAYGTSFSRDVDGGFMRFKVYRSPDAFKAFMAAKTVLLEYIEGKRVFEKSALEGAISSIVVDMADEQPTMARAAQMSFMMTVVRGLDKGWNAELLRKVREVGVAEIKQVMEEWLLPIFTPGKANLVVTCARVMVEGLEKGFSGQGFKVALKALSDFESDYGLGESQGDTGDGESRSDESEEDDDDDEETPSEMSVDDSDD